MAPPKLSDSDKQQMTAMYCQPGETTSTLSEKFGVSSSTVSRVLKQMLADEDYARLMKWKRGGERGHFAVPEYAVTEDEEASGAISEPTEAPSAEAKSAPTQAAENTEEVTSSSKTRRSRRRSAAKVSDDTDEQVSEPTPAKEAPKKSGPPKIKDKTLKKVSRATDDSDSEEDPDTEVAGWVVDELRSSDDYDTDEDEDWEEEDTWEDTADEDEEEETFQALSQEALAILSFDDFSLEKPCYLVVDRSAELITCPLKDFAELGLIPTDEEQAKTLPVFENHKVARRFARRNQRIIKVPDALMLNKTQDYLQAKGITRILFNGQIYALNEN